MESITTINFTNVLFYYTLKQRRNQVKLEDTMKKEIGPILLSGLMIGPILGSGIVLLPPMAFNILGKQALWPWMIMMLLGALFATIFSKLAILHPGEGGMTNAIEAVYGIKGKLFASYLMIGAVSIGPAAVSLTASEYIYRLPGLNVLSPSIIGILFVLLAALVLMKDLKFMSTMSFILSSIIGTVLMFSAIKTLSLNGIHVESLDINNAYDIGATLQLLFWAIIGWEIVGNYSGQVKAIKKTIPLATSISVILISLIYLAIALAMQSFYVGNSLTLIDILVPVFGHMSLWVLVILVTGLCFSTYVLIVGALSRLMYALAVEGYLPKKFGKQTQNNGFIYGILYFLGVHTSILLLNEFGILNLEKIVNIANGFFLLNAIVGLKAGSRVIDSKVLKLGCWLLMICFAGILLFSSIECYIAFVFVVFLTWKGKKPSVIPKGQSV
jgi:APA family basic amino acid/polyamine antiporter